MLTTYFEVKSHHFLMENKPKQNTNHENLNLKQLLVHHNTPNKINTFPTELKIIDSCIIGHEYLNETKRTGS